MSKRSIFYSQRERVAVQATAVHNRHMRRPILHVSVALGNDRPQHICAGLRILWHDIQRNGVHECSDLCALLFTVLRADGPELQRCQLPVITIAYLRNYYAIIDKCEYSSLGWREFRNAYIVP